MFGLRFAKRTLALGATAALLVSTLAVGSAAAKDGKAIEFDMQPSAGVRTCLPNASAHVTIKSLGPVEVMTVNLANLPPNTDFDFFVLQVPTAPFGVSWYQGDVETEGDGNSDTQPLHRPLQRRDVRRGAGRRAGPEGRSRRPVPGRDREPRLQPDPDVPPGPVVQLPRRRVRKPAARAP